MPLTPTIKNRRKEKDMPQAPKIFEGISNIDIRLKPKEYSTEVLKVVCQNLGYHFGSIILVDDHGNGSVFSSYNLPDSYPYLVHKVKAPVLSSPSGEAIKTGKNVVVNDIMNDPRLEPWYGLLTALKIRTIVWVPLFSKGKAYGTYNLYDRRKREISTGEKNILSHMSMLFSMAIMSNEYIDEIQEKTHKLENEIAERQEALKALQLARDEAENAGKAKDEFLTAMSHELRTPMNAIMGFTEILLMEEKDPGTMETLNIIRESGETLLHLINGILDFAEIESGHITLVEANFSIQDVIRRVFNKFSEKAEGKGLILEIKVEPNVPASITGDEYRLQQVISNIVDNAVKFTNQGRVRIACDHDNNNVVVRVSDTGIGIPEDKLGAVFSVFSQADMSATREHEGLGLGLTIAVKLTEKMGGSISLESTPGSGSTFTIKIPLL